jgi:hypothetical protein
VIVAPCANATTTHGWIVTTALPLIVKLAGTRCVTPSPDQVSLAVTFPVWVTTVPSVWPHAVAIAVTVTATVPLFVGSAVLVALMVYVPAAGAVNVAVRPLVASVPPAGVALHVTPPVHDALALSVATNDEVAPVLTVDGLALTVTPPTVHVGVPLVVPSVAPSEPQAACRSTAIAAAAEQSSVRQRGAVGERCASM